MPKVTVTYKARGRSNACVVPDDAHKHLLRIPPVARP